MECRSLSSASVTGTLLTWRHTVAKLTGLLLGLAVAWLAISETGESERVRSILAPRRH